MAKSLKLSECVHSNNKFLIDLQKTNLLPNKKYTVSLKNLNGSKITQDLITFSTKGEDVRYNDLPYGVFEQGDDVYLYHLFEDCKTSNQYNERTVNNIYYTVTHPNAEFTINDLSSLVGSTSFNIIKSPTYVSKSGHLHHLSVYKTTQPSFPSLSTSSQSADSFTSVQNTINDEHSKYVALKQIKTLPSILHFVYDASLSRFVWQEASDLGINYLSKSDLSLNNDRYNDDFKRPCYFNSEPSVSQINICPEGVDIRYGDVQPPKGNSSYYTMGIELIANNGFNISFMLDMNDSYYDGLEIVVDLDNLINDRYGYTYQIIDKNGVSTTNTIDETSSVALNFLPGNETLCSNKIDINVDYNKNLFIHSIMDETTRDGSNAAYTSNDYFNIYYTLEVKKLAKFKNIDVIDNNTYSVDVKYDFYDDSQMFYRHVQFNKNSEITNDSKLKILVNPYFWGFSDSCLVKKNNVPLTSIYPVDFYQDNFTNQSSLSSGCLLNQINVFTIEITNIETKTEYNSQNIYYYYTITYPDNTVLTSYASRLQQHTSVQFKLKAKNSSNAYIGPSGYLNVKISSEDLSIGDVLTITVDPLNHPEIFTLCFPSDYKFIIDTTESDSIYNNASVTCDFVYKIYGGRKSSNDLIKPFIMNVDLNNNGNVDIVNSLYYHEYTGARKRFRNQIGTVRSDFYDKELYFRDIKSVEYTFHVS